MHNGSTPVVSWEEIDTNGIKCRDNANPEIERVDERMNGGTSFPEVESEPRKDRNSEQTNGTETIRLSLTKPFLKPTLPLLAFLLRLHIRRRSLPQMTIRRRRARGSTSPAGIRDSRRRRRETLSLAVHIGTSAIPLVAILGLGAIVESLMLQSLLLQLVHGAVQAARVCGLSIRIGVAGAGAGARHGGDIVVGALVVVLLVGVLSAVTIAVGIGLI